jgi:hypothetical protein
MRANPKPNNRLTVFFNAHYTLAHTQPDRPSPNLTKSKRDRKSQKQNPDRIFNPNQIKVRSSKDLG